MTEALGGARRPQASSRASTATRATSSSSAAAPTTRSRSRARSSSRRSPYIHAEGYAAGEMKHGPIALIDEACRWWCWRRGAPATRRSSRTCRRCAPATARSSASATKGDDQLESQCDRRTVDSRRAGAAAAVPDRAAAAAHELRDRRRQGERRRSAAQPRQERHGRVSGKKRLIHVDARGAARMVDVGATSRRRRARRPRRRRCR